MNIAGMDRAKVLCALYNNARVQGLGFLHATQGDMSEEEARHLIASAGPHLYFDYLKGRVMKVDLGSEELDTRLYNRDNGPNAAEDAILEYLTDPKRS
jgi:hypothetical protein